MKLPNIEIVNDKNDQVWFTWNGKNGVIMYPDDVKWRELFWTDNFQNDQNPEVLTQVLARARLLR